MYHRFNETQITTGFIKELLKDFNLPIFKVYRDGDPIYLGRNYIKGNKMYVGAGSKDSAFLKPVNDYAYNQKQINLTTNFIINSSIYDSYTHTYLGNYLRFIRDYNHINLMPLYNCFSNEIPIDLNEHITVNGGVLEINTENRAYNYHIIPVKFNESYTIAIDSPVSYEVACILYTNSNLSTKSKEIAKLTYQKIPGSIFTQPFIYSTDIDASEYWPHEKNLKLLIKLPRTVNSSIVVMEGDYTSNNSISQNIFVPDVIIDDNNTEMVYPSKLSLLSVNDTVSYPFADRLIEYLTNNVITSKENIRENIGRLQRAIYKGSKFKGHYDIWDDNIRRTIYNRINKETIGRAINTNVTSIANHYFINDLKGNTTQEGGIPSVDSPKNIECTRGNNKLIFPDGELELNLGSNSLGILPANQNIYFAEYYDEIIKDSEGISLIKRTEFVTITDNETPYRYVDGDEDLDPELYPEAAGHYIINVLDLPGFDYNEDMICNLFQTVEKTSSTEYITHDEVDTTTLQIWVLKSRIPDGNVEKWVEDSHIQILYPRYEETIIPLSQELQENLEKLMSQKTAQEIYPVQENDGNPFLISYSSGIDTYLKYPSSKKLRVIDSIYDLLSYGDKDVETELEVPRW